MRPPSPALLRLLAFVGTLVLGVVVVIVFGDILKPLLLGLGLAYLLDPMVSWLARHGVSRPVGAVLIAVAVLVAVAVGLLFLVPAIVAQAQELVSRLPEYEAQARANLAPWIDQLKARYPAEVAAVQARAVSALKENLPSVVGRLAAWIGGLFADILRFVLFLLNLIFVPVFAFYLLVDWPRLKRGMTELIPVPYRETTLARAAEVDAAIASFLRGQLTIALVLAVINATGLVLLGVPFGLVIGLVAGLANMIPYMAPVVGLAPALLLCWFEHRSWALLLGVMAVFAGAQLLEGTVLGPRILGRSVHLHPVWVLLAVIAGGSLFGFVGMLVAVPAAASIQVFVRHWVASYKRTEIYLGDGPSGGAGTGAATAAG